MSKDKVVELVKERAELVVKIESDQVKLDKINSELISALGIVSTQVVEKSASVKKNKTTKISKKQEDEKRQPAMKEIVREFISKKPNGEGLKGVVVYINGLIESGEYKTKSKNIAPLVSQALHQLKADGSILPKKTEDNQRLYITQTQSV